MFQPSTQYCVVIDGTIVMRGSATVCRKARKAALRKDSTLTYARCFVGLGGRAVGTLWPQAH